MCEIPYNKSRTNSYSSAAISVKQIQNINYYLKSNPFYINISYLNKYQ